VTASDSKDAVRSLLRRINDAWLKGCLEDLPATLKECFSENIVFVMGPAFDVVARGREACIAGFADFAGAAKIDQCELSDPAIEVSDGTAVASYAWNMADKMKGQEHRESGHDLFVFTLTGGRWRAVWRALLVSK
jgi:hypothetical protein